MLVFLIILLGCFCFFVLISLVFIYLNVNERYIDYNKVIFIKKHNHIIELFIFLNARINKYIRV